MLIDTYDTLQGARNASIVAAELRAQGRRLRGVRLDSGDLADLSHKVRWILNDAGFPDVQILASGDLNEDRIQDLLDIDAPVDMFGVGTEIGVSYDAPALGGVYKLLEDTRGYRIKCSTGKITLPGRKQVWGAIRDGQMIEDVIALRDEPAPATGAAAADRTGCIPRPAQRGARGPPTSNVRPVEAGTLLSGRRPAPAPSTISNCISSVGNCRA